MKVLIISFEVWQNGTNGGNVLSNIFEDSGFEFAQIYCSQGNPENSLCNRYYQMNDNMAINSVLKKQPMGKSFTLIKSVKSDNSSVIAEPLNKKIYVFLRSHRLNSFYVLRDIIWNISDWRNERLRAFIDEFKPDIIFAPCYANTFMLKLTRYVAEYTHKPVISYISDDNYSLKQFHISPIYWIHRFVLRAAMRKTFKCYSLVYTMTDEQKQECEDAFSANMKILRKGVKEHDYKEKKINKPIKIIYAGGIYCGRWKTLAAVAKAIKKINTSDKQMELHIYTGNSLTKHQDNLLNDGQNSFVHGLISFDELKKKYNESDIALHVESFDIKNRLLTRLSFSTKIVDCLESTCAVMAIAWKNHSGLTYLKKEDAAVCIDSKKEIYNVLKNLCEQKDIIDEYRYKAYICGQKNHSKETISKQLNNDFNEFI